MKTIVSGILLVGALTLTSCAHKGHHHEGREKAGQSCCKEKKDCKDGSCELKKGEKKAKGCCGDKKKK